MARTFGQPPGVGVTLLHILPGFPPAFWDIGHVLTEDEKKGRERLWGVWEEEKEKKWKGLLKNAQERFVGIGISATAITREFEPDYSDLAQAILDTARNGGYSAIVMGHRGLRTLKSILLGGVTNKVVQHVRGSR